MDSPATEPIAANALLARFRGQSRKFWLLLAAVVALGVGVRVYPTGPFPVVGFDAELYRNYIVDLEARGGLAHYPEICRDYNKRQKAAKLALLPPTRFLFIFSGYVWKRAVYGGAPPLLDLKAPGALWTDPTLRSLRGVVITFSTLLFLLSGVAAWRMLGLRAACGIMALFACAPVQVHMSQNVLIDGFVAFWSTLSLWLLWENLQRPRDWRWLVALGISLASMVTVKENAAFVFVGLGGAVALNRWQRFGIVTPWLLLAMLTGPLLGILVLIKLAGGWDVLSRSYQLLVSKASAMPYAIATGDGPWYRYLLEIFMVSPWVFCLAVAGVFCVAPEHRAFAFLLTFMAGSYLLMCNVPHGMNLRYSTIWDLTIRALAWGQLAWFARRFGARQDIALVIIVAFLCGYDLRQYYLISVAGYAHELVPKILLQALNIMKPGA